MLGFPKETLCPITLYELGTWSILSQRTGTKIFIGCHKEYLRRVPILSSTIIVPLYSEKMIVQDDVVIQTELSGLSATVVFTLEDLADQVNCWYRSFRK